MQTQSIAAGTGMGAVEIAVTDGNRALRFYRDYVGLTPLPSDGDAIRMGVGDRELVVLFPNAGRPVVPRTSGLYHLALLVPDRRELARVIGRLARLRWEQYPTDHVMTKANYLWDPDGNGIEVYTESPEDGTMGMVNGTFGARDKDGRPRSGRDPIDLEELFSHRREGDRLDAPMPDATKMGHVHLHVADVDDALRFYHDLVGFDVMGHVPGVGFISAGGYHHHLGLNEWAGH
ncbi:MAG TPA: VOC family protein, partial [Methylomirabilota bacterium]|nr:VOC family protein [Methylomirabilota bacterium]